MPRSQPKTESIVPESDWKALYHISILIQNSLPAEESYEEILKSIGKLVDFRSASLFLLSKETGKLEEICSFGRTVDLINFVNFNMGSGISAWVAQKNRPIILNNLRKSRGGTHTKSFLSVPMVLSGEVRGVINLAHDEPDSFTENDAERLGIVATMISLFVERIQHAGYEKWAKKEFESLNEALQVSREKLGQVERIQPGAESTIGFARRISNPLAIIAGNAQFLLMTMKNPGNSVLKRLKAIDTEASHLMTITGGMLGESDKSASEFRVTMTAERN